jgi:hypothetical protein
MAQAQWHDQRYQTNGLADGHFDNFLHNDIGGLDSYYSS